MKDYTVPLARTLLHELEQLPDWITRLEHFLVDEYQDFNPAEQTFLRALLQHAVSTVIVGDDDQSMYSGRGGSPNGLRVLFGSSTSNSISLVYSYRCKANILAAANRFLSTMRQDPRLLHPHNPDGRVSCFTFANTKAELEFLVAFINERLAVLPDKPKPKDGVVCLFPSQRVLNYYLKLLQDAGVRCYSRKLPRNSKRLFLHYALALIQMPHQRFVERLMLEYFPGIKPRHKRIMVGLILEQDISPVDALKKLLSTAKLSKVAKIDVERFCELCDALASKETTRSADSLATFLKLTPEKIELELSQFLTDLDEGDPENSIETLCDILVPESAAPPEDHRAVLCLTMHGSKGLTRHTVVMPGLEAVWLPGDTSGEQLEERKRLFYVALTRATDQVVVTLPRTRRFGDSLNRPKSKGSGQPSPFIKDSGIVLQRFN